MRRVWLVDYATVDGARQLTLLSRTRIFGPSIEDEVRDLGLQRVYGPLEEQFQGQQYHDVQRAVNPSLTPPRQLTSTPQFVDSLPIQVNSVVILSVVCSQHV